MKNYLTEAFILKKTKLGEADHILTFLTPEYGKVQAVAKGVRKPGSKMAGHLELLTHSRIFLAQGRNLDTVTGCQTIDAFLSVKEDLELTAQGLYISELAFHFTTEHQENRKIFELLLKTMQHLCDSAVNNQQQIAPQPSTPNIPPSTFNLKSSSLVLLRYFETQLLKESGYGPELQQCLACFKPLEPVINYFHAPSGGTLCPNCGSEKSFALPVSVNAIKVLRLLRDDYLATAARLKINARLMNELEDILRRYIIYILERDVKSTEWMDKLKAIR